MVQISILDVRDHASGLCCTIAVKVADCTAPMQFIHAVSESCAGYFFTVNAYSYKNKNFLYLSMHLCFT